MAGADLPLSPDTGGPWDRVHWEITPTWPAPALCWRPRPGLPTMVAQNPPAPFKFLPVCLRSPWFGQFMSVPPGAFDVHISSKHQVSDTFIVRATILREGDLEWKEGAEA